MVVLCTNMNQGGVPYAISNPPGSTPNWHGTPGRYSTDFESNVVGKVEHFDVYGEVRTMYSQVYWTRNTPINLPPEIVTRFKGKVMAITGYEVDQVTHTGPQFGSTTSGSALGGFSCFPDCGETDKSVPIYNAYNHHYFSWLTGSDSEIYELDNPLLMPNPTTTAFRMKNGTKHGFPTSIVYKENPGGEFRKSYHGYPNGFAQLIHSPLQWVVEPMQIDTHNRNYTITEQVGYQPSFLPEMVMNNMTNLKNSLSPLIECPCSDRIKKTTVNSSSILTTGTCKAPITSEKACAAAVAATGAQVSTSMTIKDSTQPAGCIMKPDSLKWTGNGLYTSVPKYSAIFNKVHSTQPCGINPSSIALEGISKLGSQVNVSLSYDGTSANITLSGPATVWFGVGFDATSMKDEPYTIIVDGNGAVTERKLANHGPGTLLTPSIKVISNSVHGNVRILILNRAVQGSTNDHFSFPTKPGDFNMIAAVGDSVALAYHKERTGGKITLIPTETSACVCMPSTTTYLTYMDTSTQKFHTYDCVDEPRSDMLRHGDGTGRELSNQACQMETYHGGLQCCRNSWFLTDRAQDSLIPRNKVDKYFLKWRYYFQEYVPASTNAPASHKHLHHWVFLIDDRVNDYEEDNAEYGKESIGKISAHLKARYIGLEDLRNPTDDGAPPVPGNYTTITPMVMTPHCHAPSCIREEFWNADTGEIICNMTAKYGDEKYGPTINVFNELDYLTILPCIYGYQPGLQTPFNLTSDINITAIKYFNNTFRHLGQMAQWTGLMVYDTDPY